MGEGWRIKQTHKQIVTATNYSKCHEGKGAMRTSRLGLTAVAGAGSARAGKTALRSAFPSARAGRFFPAALPCTHFRQACKSVPSPQCASNPNTSDRRGGGEFTYLIYLLIHFERKYTWYRNNSLTLDM